MKKIIPEMDEIVKFYSPEIIEQIARETGFVQRESKFGGTEFLKFSGSFALPNVLKIIAVPTIIYSPPNSEEP